MPLKLSSALDSLLDKTVVLSYNRLGYALRQSAWDPAEMQVDMRGKVCLVTGATGGLGLVTARRLAELGATVVLVGRSAAKGEAAVTEIRRSTGNDTVYFEAADLSSIAQTNALAERLARRESGLDVLINNAGVLLAERQLSVEGLEMTFATNVLSGFLLTQRLRPLLTARPGGRVIFVSSGGMYSRKLNPSDLQFEREAYNGPAAYAQSKRAQVILAEMFAERWADTGVTVNSMHPGWADTPGLRTSLPGFSNLMSLTLRSPEQGADTVVWLAVSPRVAGERGKFWFDRRARETHKFSFTRNTPAERQQLWDECVRLSGLEL